jgi:methylglyoxal synthase
MERKTFPMERQKKIALLAHDNTKTDLVQWAKDNKERLANHELFATGSTGEELEDELGFEVRTLLHGPLGGDLQIGGTLSHPSPTTQTFRPSCGWRCCGTSP